MERPQEVHRDIGPTTVERRHYRHHDITLTSGRSLTLPSSRCPASPVWPDISGVARLDALSQEPRVAHYLTVTRLSTTERGVFPNSAVPTRLRGGDGAIARLRLDLAHEHGGNNSK